MPAAKTPNPTPLHERLLQGLDTKRRPDGSVYTIKGADGKVVGEVCVGKNVAAARALLAAITSAPAKAPTASDAAKVSAKATAEAGAARKAVARVARRSGAKVTA